MQLTINEGFFVGVAPASGGKRMDGVAGPNVSRLSSNSIKDVLIIQNRVFSISLNLNKTHISFCQLKVYDLEQHHP